MSRRSPVPPIAELRPVAQGSKTRADRRWSYRAFRSVSIYVTWLFLHTSITPNQVTILSLVIAGGGLMMVGASSPGVAVGGCVLLLVYHLLDRVDGEIARYRRTYSLYGVYLDNAGHYLTGAGLLVAATYRLAPMSADPQMIWLLGSIGAVASMLSRVEKHAPFHLYSQYVVELPELVETVADRGGSLTRESTREARAETGGESDSLRGLVTLARNLLLTLTAFPVAVVLIGIAFLGETIQGEAAVPVGMLITVAALQTVAYLGVEFANLTQNLGAETRRLSDLATKDSDPDLR